MRRPRERPVSLTRAVKAPAVAGLWLQEQPGVSRVLRGSSTIRQAASTVVMQSRPNVTSYPVDPLRMTHERAIELARRIVVERKWTWRTPVRVLSHRVGFAGRELLVVVTSPDFHNRWSRIEFDARTGELRGADFGQL